MNLSCVVSAILLPGGHDERSLCGHRADRIGQVGFRARRGGRADHIVAFARVRVYRLWGSDSVAKLPTDATAPPQPRYFPPPGGFRFVLVTLPPGVQEAVAPPDLGVGFVELQQKLPGMAEFLEPANPGMHTTDTVDFDVILSGEVYLELDDRAEVLLRAGDCVVQNGTRHAWRNRGSQDCVLAVALVGAERRSS